MGTLLTRAFGSMTEVLRDFRFSRTDPRLVEWRSLAAQTRDLGRFAASSGGPRLVFLPMIGNMSLTNFELLLGLALNYRGAAVEMVFDDAVLPLCELTTAEVVQGGQKEFCAWCIRNIRTMACPVPLRIRYLSEFVSAKQLAAFRDAADEVDPSAIETHEREGIPLGRSAVMATMRHFRKGRLEGSADEVAVLRKYLVSAMLSKFVAERLTEEGAIHAALMSHGIYPSWEPALEVFKARAVQVATYDRQGGKDKYQFNWNVSAQSQDMSGAWEREWRHRSLTADERRDALEYLASRETFERESCKFSDAAPLERQRIRADLGVPANKVALLLVSNLVWDAAAAGRDLIFPDTVTWVKCTVDEIAKRPGNLHLIVKPHPAETMRGTKLFVGDEIRRIYGRLPSNVTVLAPDATINPMSLMKAIDVGIAHTSTAGLEMAVLGKPVIPVSHAHYRGKGFTFDPASLGEYLELLGSAGDLPARYSDEMKELALKYFYVRFFKYQHALPLVRESEYLKAVGYQIGSLDQLAPGRIQSLDFVCDAVLSHRKDFVAD